MWHTKWHETILSPYPIFCQKSYQKQKSFKFPEAFGNDIISILQVRTEVSKVK